MCIINCNNYISFEKGIEFVNFEVDFVNCGYIVCILDLNFGLYVVEVKDGKFYGVVDLWCEGIVLSDKSY